MGFLEKLGLAHKSKGNIPIGENKRKEQLKARNKRSKIIRWVTFLGFLGLMIYALPDTTYRQIASYTIGEPWRADDLTAPFSFALLKSGEELEEEREQVRQNVPPIFHINENAVPAIENRTDSLFNQLQPVLDSYVQWQRAEQDPDVSNESDSLRFADELEQSNIDFTEEQWELLLESYADVQLENGIPENFIGNQIENLLVDITRQLMNDGLINISKDDIANDNLTVRNLRERTERNVSLTNTYDPGEAREFAEIQFSSELDSEYVPLAKEFFNRVIVPNWTFSSADTQSRLDEALDEISTTKGAVSQGQVIIRRGDIVTEERANMLRSLADARADMATDLERWSRFGGEVLILVITSLFFLFYLFLYRRQIFDNGPMFLLVFLVLGLVIIASSAVHNFEDISAYVVPIAVAPLILTIIFDSRVGLLAALTLAIITSIYHDNNFEYLVATIMACSFGIFSVRDINKRTQFFVTTPLVVFSGYLLIVSGFMLTRFGSWDIYLNEMVFIAINCIFILFTYPLILLFEKTFDLTTDFTLLELADTNLPLLKDLMNKAPGTFHHSLQVSNLAESAASEIGANALLCRVGALYHDIGKMNKPGYFIENQTGKNEHDKLKPRMSALVIKAHVSDGVKMAEEHDLPDDIIDFIRTHHGTSLIRYFYDRALKNASENEEIREEDFRYDGPLPKTMESGILLLADGIEAASRSMKNPTFNKLESLINRMVDDHVHEGQLNHCPLTFHQIDIIKKTFLNVLKGVYHSRVEYPEDEKRNASESAESKQKTQKNLADQQSDSQSPEHSPGKKETENQEHRPEANQPPQTDDNGNTKEENKPQDSH